MLPCSLELHFVISWWSSQSSHCSLFASCAKGSFSTDWTSIIRIGFWWSIERHLHYHLGAWKRKRGAGNGRQRHLVMWVDWRNHLSSAIGSRVLENPSFLLWWYRELNLSNAILYTCVSPLELLFRNVSQRILLLFPQVTTLRRIPSWWWWSSMHWNGIGSRRGACQQPAWSIWVFESIHTWFFMILDFSWFSSTYLSLIYHCISYMILSTHSLLSLSHQKKY